MTHETAIEIEAAMKAGGRMHAVAAAYGVAPQDVRKVVELGADCWHGCGRPISEILREKWDRDAEAEQLERRARARRWYERNVLNL